jgi:hypothetical protein
LQVDIGLLELQTVRLRRAAGVVELADHAVERSGEYAQLVAARDPRPPGEIPPRHRERRLGELGERLRQPPAEDERERDRGEEREQQREGQREEVDALEAGLRSDSSR